MSKEVVTADTSDSCVICCHLTDVWAVGECNHPTCLVCCARMRILCGQKDCPVCRLPLNQIVILSDVRPFQSLMYRKWPSKCRHNLYFETWDLFDMFQHITDNWCQLCPHLPPQRSFKKLKEHIKSHGFFFCDICVDGLKLFPSEFKMYTRYELSIHRRQGDSGDKSYKGHPYCQFCDERFLDNDMLHMHLRKSHFWCHFCESEGKQDYYMDCHSLKRHFREDHFLCEEGSCKYEVLTSAFGNEIDLKAHRASVHSKGMSRAEAKMMRAVPVDFSFTGHQHDSDVPLTMRRGHSAISMGHGHGNRENDSNMRALQVWEEEEREPLAVTMTHSTRTLSERSKKSGKNTSPPLTRKKRRAQGHSHGPPPPHLTPSPVIPPGFEIVRSGGSIQTSIESHAENRNIVKDKDDRTKNKDDQTKNKDDRTKNNCWPLLGVGGAAPLSQPSTPPPPGLKNTHRKEARDGKDGGFVKVVQLPSKSLETRCLGNIKQSSSEKLVSLKPASESFSQKMLPLKPASESFSTEKTATDSSSTSEVKVIRIFDEIRQALGYNQEKFEEFQTLSGWYRRGAVSIGDYHSHCEELFGGKWFIIGPQLAKIMPRGERKEKLIESFVVKMSDGVSLNEGSSNSKKKKMKKNSRTKKDEDAWVTVGGGVGTRHATPGRRSQAVFSEEDYPCLTTAAKLPQSKVPLHSAWNVQVHS